MDLKVEKETCQFDIKTGVTNKYQQIFQISMLFNYIKCTEKSNAKQKKGLF